jgi:hypothetical protein
MCIREVKDGERVAFWLVQDDNALDAETHWLGDHIARFR